MGWGPQKLRILIRVLAATGSYPHLFSFPPDSYSDRLPLYRFILPPALTPTDSSPVGSYSYRLLGRCEFRTSDSISRHSSLNTRHCSGDFRSRQIDSSSSLGQPIAEAGECARPG